jgi:hypothetical protein
VSVWTGAPLDGAGRILSPTEILEHVAQLAQAAGVNPHELAIGHSIGFRSDEAHLVAAHELLDLLPADDPVFQMPGPKRRAGAYCDSHGRRNLR